MEKRQRKLHNFCTFADDTARNRAAALNSNKRLHVDEYPASRRRHELSICHPFSCCAARAPRASPSPGEPRYPDAGSQDRGRTLSAPVLPLTPRFAPDRAIVAGRVWLEQVASPAVREQQCATRYNARLLQCRYNVEAVSAKLAPSFLVCSRRNQWSDFGRVAVQIGIY